ncbi:MAG: hypothetical protein RRY36_04915 [Bacteroidaceae bacterium]
METMLIDEKELTEKFVKRANEINKILSGCINREMVKQGLNPDNYVGGLCGVICSEGMSLEDNIKNLFAAFSNNYGESVFFQCDSIKKMHTLNLVIDYLKTKGLENDFLKFRDERKAVVTTSDIVNKICAIG